MSELRKLFLPLVNKLSDKEFDLVAFEILSIGFFILLLSKITKTT